MTGEAPGFDEATAVSAEPDGSYSALIPPTWHAEHGPHGGQMAAVLTRVVAAVGADDGQRPASVTYQFLQAPRGERVRVHADVLRRGGTVTAVSLRMDDAEGTLAVSGLATLARSRPELRHLDIDMPDADRPEQCPVWHGEPWEFAPVFARYDARWALGPRPYSGEETRRTAAWLRIPGVETTDAPVLAFLSDAFMTPLYARVTEPVISMTVELQLTFAADLLEAPLPSHGWVLALFVSQAAGAGFVEDLCQLWTPDGRLLATGRQLGALRGSGT